MSGLPSVPTDDLDAVCEHVGGRWLELRGRRLLITGGTGFVGTWLLETLAWANRKLDLRARAVVLTRDVRRFAAKAPHLVADPMFVWHPGDVRSFEFPREPCWGVIHAAFDAGARNTGGASDDVVGPILDGTRRTLEFAAAARPSRYMFISSGAVYGPQPPELTHMPETFVAPRPADPSARNVVYGEAKRQAEELVHTATRMTGLHSSIARLFAFVGPHLPLDGSFAVGNFIGDALAGRPLQLSGDGTPWRSYLYAADMAEWLWTMLLSAGPDAVLNVGSEEAVQLGDVARMVAALAEPPVEVRLAKQPDSPRPAERYVPSCRLAAETLRLVARTPLSEALRRTYDWHRQRATPSRSRD